MGANHMIRPQNQSDSKLYKSKQLSRKVIYLIATGAKKIERLPELIELLNNYQATVFLLTSKAAFRMMQSTKLIDTLEDLNVTVVTDYGHPFELPPEDLVVIAPCTFNSLQKLASGIADNYILTITANAIARKTPVVMAPAFNELWYHPQTSTAINTLTQWGVRVVWPEITAEKVTMMDVVKIFDTVHAELSKVKFTSRQLFNSEVEQLRHSAIESHLQSFADVGIFQHQGNLNSATHGCYSVRLDEEWMLITSSGASLNELSADDLVLVQISDSNIVTWVGTKPPSSETPLHIQLYRTNSHYSAIIHSHSPEITYSPAKRHLATPKYVEYGVFDGVEAICQQCDNQSGFVILRYHGELAADNTLQGALNKIQVHGK